MKYTKFGLYHLLHAEELQRNIHVSQYSSVSHMTKFLMSLVRTESLYYLIKLKAAGDRGKKWIIAVY